MIAPPHEYIGLAALLTITPGADMALVMSNTLRGGRRAGMFTTVGICAGLSVHAIASAYGLSAILRISAVAYNGVKLCGAAYLIFLGVQTLRTSLANPAAEGWVAASAAPENAPDAGLLRRSFRQGVLTNLLNPKVALFYLTLLPQFVAPTEPALRKSLFLAAIHIGMGCVWLTAYAYFLGGMRSVMARPAVKRNLERATAGVLLLLGARLAWEK